MQQVAPITKTMKLIPHTVAECNLPNIMGRLPAGYVRREEFDPCNIEHMESYKNFLVTGNWTKVQFFCEYPCKTVPETVHKKFALAHIDNYIANVHCIKK